jgi:uncharacterized protein
LLAHGTTVIVAHCASLGHARDTDRPAAPDVPAFDLFARLMAEREWEGRLFGDLSAVFQRNRTSAVWRAVLANEHWHGRLLHGSDHPLPGIVPLYSTPRLVKSGLLAAAHAPPLARMREHNALLFDVVLKRSLRLGATGLPAAIFEARALDALRAA